MKSNEMQFKNLSVKKKMEYVLEYYKFAIILSLIVIYISSYIAYRNITDKEIGLSIAFANVTLSQERYDEINSYYMDELGLDSSNYKIEMYKDLYIAKSNLPQSDADYEYAYASTSKLMALLAQGNLDIIFTDYDTALILKEKGYIKELEKANSLPFFKDMPIYICHPKA